MNSLRNRIAALLVISIIAVVALATFTAMKTLQPPSPAATIEPIARQLAFAVKIAEAGNDAALDGYYKLSQTPPEGENEEMLSHFLETALSSNGTPYVATVVRQPGREAPTAAIALERGGWLETEIPNLGPPSGGWKSFGMWIALIVLGSAVVSIVAARKMTRPLEILESVADRIGPDGALPALPDAGPAEIRTTVRAINSLSTRLKSAMESRMRLVAAAGHDLRTPMTRMRLRAEFVENDEEREKWLNDLQELDAIADSAILLVREEVTKTAVEQTDIVQLLRQIVKDLEHIDHAGPIRLIVPEAPLLINAAPLALKRALQNLILNAATHGKSAEVTVSRQSHKVHLNITDQGPGIPPDLITRVFEPFFRVDPARRKSVPGAGLGLAIAKEIIERFGGKLAISNRDEGGLQQMVCFELAKS
ncbi:ATP-binding protein [Agrobacterium larrymoorei]|uniref:histidine kinase n=1 Tax=Agrobacterium larrymoorei TaxID=160699 RepID=A0A4D7DX45_9HYPH|nr:ATP-binding protein [Agrobacterium larrymoorei]QCI99389.1 HAMP domain-containing protein [Agrobacterium larrymoorei]QYA08931.1 HAMP domain-containing protein [Agrobacterium larrymoorei]